MVTTPGHRPFQALGQDTQPGPRRAQQQALHGVQELAAVVERRVQLAADDLHEAACLASHADAGGAYVLARVELYLLVVYAQLVGDDVGWL